MYVEEKKKFAASIAISSLVAVAAALMVSIVAYVDKNSESKEEVAHITQKVMFQNEEIKEKLRDLRERIYVLEQDAKKNKRLIETFNTNLEFQTKVIQALIVKENKGEQ